MQSTMHSWVSGHRKKEGQEGRLLIHTTKGLGTTQLCLETIYKRLFNIRSRLQVSKLRQIRRHSMQGDERPQNPPALTFWTLSQPLCASHMLKGTKPICSNFSLRKNSNNTMLQLKFHYIKHYGETTFHSKDHLGH